MVGAIDMILRLGDGMQILSYSLLTPFALDQNSMACGLIFVLACSIACALGGLIVS